ncbi:ABC transporter ATP-binding protein [Butyrivibrio sp. NC3005]|uniref:ABC transporter ATP-binding protein n=1 Tax=Butyrivibrio sp. NC3005 TaxID=1280685 RepID=UPI0003FEAC90|nr:ABC transporter ATP-binding protein [Butyrivibrio sp. NC3005]
MNPFKKNTKFYLGIIFTVIEGILSACVYMMIYNLLKMLLDNDVTMDKLMQLTWMIVGIFAVRIVLYGTGYTLGQIGGGDSTSHLRLVLGDKFTRIPIGNFVKGKTGTYINTMTSDVKNYEQLLTHKIGNLVKNSSLSAMLILFVGYMYLPAGIILFAVSLLFIPYSYLSVKVVEKYGVARNKIYADTVSTIVEYINGLQTLRAYNMCGSKNKKTKSILKDFSDVSYKYEATGIPVAISFNIIIWLTLPLVMMVASRPWLAGTLSNENFLMVCMMPMLLARMFASISVDFFSYKNMMISKGKIQEIIDEPEEKTGEIVFEPKSYDIEFKNVDFSYTKEEQVLKDVSFKVGDRSLTAIVGDSGSGKSTIINLLSKYYDIDSGDIKIGGISIKNIPPEEVLKKISMVDQDVFLFDGTIKENIRYARTDATDKEINDALKEANCDSFIDKLEKGVDQRVGENGTFLSGGERQRISIARAIIKNSPILLLDEATASLDIENELAVKKAIANLLKSKKTVIMIAHTLSVVKNADNIIVVSGGRIVESGTHEKLLQKNGKYASMWNAEKLIGA